MVIPKLVRCAVFNDLQELFGLFLSNVSWLGGFGAVPLQNIGQSGFQSVLLLTANGAAHIISFAAGKSTDLLKELNRVLLVDQVAEVIFQKVVNDRRRVVMRLSLKQFVPIRSARRSDAGCDQRHIINAVRLKLSQTVKCKCRLELENTDGGAQHVIPNSVIIPIDFVRLGVWLPDERIGVFDNLDIFQAEDIILHQAGFMNALHINL
mgnify:CR=1 FL=1